MTSMTYGRVLLGIVGFTLAAAGCDNTALVGAQNAPAAGGALGGGAGGETPIVSLSSWLFFDSLRGFNRDIYAVRADGSSLKRITTSTTTEREPSVSPDGSTLAFSSDAGGSFQIYLEALPTGVPRKLTSHAGGADQPTWSPDGKLLAFHSGVAVYVIGSDGQDERMAAAGPDELNVDSHAAFAPGGHALLFDRGNQIHEVDLDTGVETSVVQNTTTAVQHPSVSPDGHSIAFSIQCDVSGASVWISPLAADTQPCVGGARVTTTAESPARFPSFSPQGLIAFEHGDGKALIGLVNPGQAARDVTHGEGDDRNPSWSPAGLVLP